MTPELFKWLEERWKRDNHPKYQHLFSIWILRLTPEQIAGFSQQEQKRNIYD
jgi:hypothetical protein